jgi:hypothetical protein
MNIDVAPALLRTRVYTSEPRVHMSVNAARTSACATGKKTL